MVLTRSQQSDIAASKWHRQCGCGPFSGSCWDHDPRRCVWSEPFELMDGLSYRWWHGKDLIKVEFFGTPKADGTGNAVARTSFRLKPGALLEHPSAPILLQLDAEAAALAEAQRLSDEQIRDRTLQEVVAAWNAGGPSSDRHTLLFRLREVEDVPDHVWEALLSDRLSGGDLLLPALVGEDIVSRRAAGFLCSADSGKAFMVVMDATINLFLAYDTDDPAAPEWV